MLDMTSFDAALKVHYGPQRLKEISFRRRPLLGMMPKYTRFGGRNMPLPIKFAATHNRAGSFAEAQRSAAGSPAATDSASYEEFLLTRVKNYGLAFVDGETIKASEGDVNAFIRAVSSEFDSCLEALADDTHQDLYTDGIGSRAVLSAVAGAPTYTVADPEDLVRIDVGMALTFATAAAAGALRNSGQTETVTAINRSAGTFTLSGTITGGAIGDHVFVFGDRQAGAITTQRRKLSGLDAWIPATDPTAGDSHFGVDRSQDPLKLGGLRVAFNSNIKDTLRKAAIEIGRYGGNGDQLFMNHTDLDELLGEMESDVTYDVIPDPEGIIGFETVRVATPLGRASVHGDHACPVDVAYLLSMETWRLASAGDVPMNLNADGNRMLRQATADSYEARFGYYAQVGCDRPGWNARLALA